jgi:hypothetical protein
LIAHFSKKVSLDTATNQLIEKTQERCVTYLTNELIKSDPAKLWTGEAWSNGQILWILNLSAKFPGDDREIVEKSIWWFENQQSADGNWSDVEDTASAIIGLYSLLQSLVTLTTETGPAETAVLDRLDRRLRKAVPVPKLQIKKKLVHFDDETDYLSLNFTRRSVRSVATVMAFIFVALIGWIANMMAVFEGIWKYLKSE